MCGLDGLLVGRLGLWASEAMIGCVAPGDKRALSAAANGLSCEMQYQRRSLNLALNSSSVSLILANLG